MNVTSATPSSGLAEEICFTLEPATELSDLGVRWRELEAHADASFFQSWDWIGCWVREAQLLPLVLIGRRSGQIVALGLLQPSQLHRHLIVKTNALLLHHLGHEDKDILTIAYNGFLTHRAVGWRGVQACINAIFTTNAARQGHQLRLDELHLKGVSQQYEQYARAPGVRQVLLSRNRSWKVDLEKIRASGRSYLDHLSANTRYQIRRSIGLYKARGQLVVTRAGNVEEALVFFNAMKHLSILHWSTRGQVGSFAYPFFESFHKRLIRACVPRRTVEVLQISAGKQLIGYLYNFVYKGWIYAYQSAFVYEDDPKLKPGLVSHELCIELHLREGARIYDFLAGYSRYKANLGTSGLQMLDIVLQRPTIKLKVEDFLRKAKRVLNNRITKGSELNTSL